MIKKVSFRIDDAEGMNKVLAVSDFVPSAGFAVSGSSLFRPSYISFSVDDGEPDTVANKILDHKKVLRNDLNLLEATQFNMAIIDHDIAELDAHMSTKEVVEKKKEWEASLKKMEEIKAARLLTEAELYRLNKEIKLRRARIAELEATA